MQNRTVDRRMDDVEIPLKNVEFTIQQYLMVHGTRLDTETRVLLAGIRDCVSRVAMSPGAKTAENTDLGGRPDDLPELLAS